MTPTTLARKNDAQIHAEVLDELRWDPRVEETEVGIQVKDGIVTLTGTVTSYAKKLAALEAAHRVTGVLDVANDIEVRIPGGQTRTDTEIAKGVRQALEWDVLVPDRDVRTTVSNGWVTLEGSVDRWPQREDAAKAVHRLAGVTGVTNKIVVKASPVEPDRIRELIEEALERQADREARRLEISVRSGVVSLAGSVRTWAEKHAAIGAATCAPGIVSVDDRLHVDPFV